MKKAKITTVPKDIDYIEYALEFGDTGIPVIDLMDAQGRPIPTNNYVYPTHTRKEMLVKMRTQDSKVFTEDELLGRDINLELYDEFTNDLNTMLQKIKNAGINVYINADQEVGIRTEKVPTKYTIGQDHVKITLYFDYMIEPNDIYSYYFIDGVTEKALDISCLHAMLNVKNFINNLRPKLL